MGVRILYDTSLCRSFGQACLYCSTSGWAFGPVFSDGEDGTPANEMAQRFLTWLDTYTPPTQEHLNVLGLRRWQHDPRELTDRGLEHAYSEWLAHGKIQQEAAHGRGD